MSTAGPGNRGVSRVLKKLESSVNSQNWFVKINYLVFFTEANFFIIFRYEAHQMYRTIYFRYLSQKNFVELLDLLYKGDSQFFVPIHFHFYLLLIDF